MRMRISKYDLPAFRGPFAYGIGQTVSRFLIYALTEPDTDAVRYIGRSCTGLLRPREHSQRAGRERTHKATWIRSLVQTGTMYGVRVLEECSDVRSTIEAEIRWIAEGKRLGWALTNHTDGGEGATCKKLDLPDGEIVRRYLDGESELALAKAYQVNRWTITRRLTEAGVDRRDGSAANINRAARLAPEQRKANATAAHNARRGSKVSDEVRERMTAAQQKRRRAILAESED